MPGKMKIPCLAGMVSLILLVACSSAIVTAAAATLDNATLVRMHGGDFNVTRHPFTDKGMLRDSAVTPTPVTLFRAEHQWYLKPNYAA